MTYTWIRAVTSQVISTSPACVGAVLVTSDAVGNADIALYDGQNTGEPPILTIRALQYETKVVNFQPYLVTKRGLYVALGSNVREVLFQLAWSHE